MVLEGPRIARMLFVTSDIGVTSEEIVFGESRRQVGDNSFDDGRAGLPGTLKMNVVVAQLIVRYLASVSFIWTSFTSTKPISNISRRCSSGIGDIFSRPP
jgi:hypothetical protein